MAIKEVLLVSCTSAELLSCVMGDYKKRTRGRMPRVLKRRIESAKVFGLEFYAGGGGRCKFLEQTMRAAKEDKTNFAPSAEQSV